MTASVHVTSRRDFESECSGPASLLRKPRGTLPETETQLMLRRMAYSAQFTKPEPARDEIDSAPGLVLLEFGTDWCPHCQRIQPILQAELAKHPEIRHLKIEDGKGRRLGRSFQVKLWPNLVFLRDGKIVTQLARASDSEIEAAFEQLTRRTFPT